MSLLKKGTYNAEEILQKILADYPALLAGEQISPEEPRRWLLIAREFPIPDPEDGAARWSLDHLFVDQEAVPTLVEVKRSSDTRIRREVIAQMLDYAANSSLWRIEDLIRSFENTCAGEGVSPDEKLAEFLGGDRTPEDFWQSVKSNLGSARLRLLFVADEIPVQLQSIVEFLNNQMNSTQVLAVAIPQYVGEDGLTAYVPRLLGQTAQGQLRRSTIGGASRSIPAALDRKDVLDRIAACSLSDQAKGAFSELVAALSEADGEFRSGTSDRSLFGWYWHALGTSSNRLLSCGEQGGIEWCFANVQRGVQAGIVPPDWNVDLKKALAGPAKTSLTDKFPLTNVKEHLDAGRWGQVIEAVQILIRQRP